MKRSALGITVLLTLSGILSWGEQLVAAAQMEGAKLSVADPEKPAAEWLTDYETALKKAKDLNRPILLDFTGSDWCGGCIKLKKEVFDTPEFKKYASENLILVELDFPMRKPQPPALKSQNRKLQAQFSIQGYPTIVLLDTTGKEIGRTGYRPGGGASYVKHLQELLSKTTSNK
jgi:protein disulfide-isomerase